MTDSRVPFSGPIYGAFQLLLVVSIIPGIAKGFQYASCAILVWISHYLITKTTTGNPAVDLAQGSAIATQLMNAMDIMFFTHPDTLTDLYHGQKGKITDAPLKERARWAVNLYTNTRGIGWAHESPYTPPRVPPNTSRWSFALRQLRRATLCMGLESAIYVVNASNPAMTFDKTGLTGASFVLRALGVAGFAAGGYARINWMNCLLSAAVVAAGFSAPERWPNLFGSFLEAWSVQRFWRFVWHHLLRKLTKTLATFLTTTIFRLPSRPSASTIAQKLIWLCCAFFVTGAIHVPGEIMLLGRVGYGAFTFFMLQPLGIAIETLVAFLWCSLASPSSNAKIAPRHINLQKEKYLHQPMETNTLSAYARSPSQSPNEANRPAWWVICIGYLWVALWFVWSLAFMIDPMIPTGMFVDPRVDLRRVQWLAHVW